MKYLQNDRSLLRFRRNLRRNQTDAEKRLWFYLRAKKMRGLKFFRQYSFGRYILDFYCPSRKFAIEIDGSQHMDNQDYDSDRTDYLSKHGIKVLRFWNNDVLSNTSGVLEHVGFLLDDNPTLPPLLDKRRSSKRPPTTVQKMSTVDRNRDM